MNAKVKQLQRIAIVLGIAIVASMLSAGAAPHIASAGSSPPLIAFDDNENGVFTTPAGGVAPENYVPNSSQSPAFAPNGVELAFITNDYPANTATISVATRTGGSAQVLLTGVPANGGLMKDISGPLAWSPDGKEIAYGCGGALADGLKVFQLCTVDVSSGDTQRITDADNENFLIATAHTDRLSWSSDGKAIIADVNKPLPCDVVGDTDCGNDYVGAINVASGKVAVLSDDVGYSPDLSPDGTHIIYYNPGAEVGTSKGIYIMSIAGGIGQLVVPQSELIGEASSVDPDPFYSPDGNDIVFGAFGMGTNPDYLQLFRLPVDGDGTPLQLTDHPNNVYDGQWSPPVTTCTVPKLKGLTIKAAKKELTKNACALGKVKGPKKHRAHRHVTKQTIKPNTEKIAGTKVGITVK